jgi:ribonuclease Z
LAEVRLLALTHVSTRYFGSELATEAREVFPETVVPRDFDVIEVPFPERGAPQLVKAGARPVSSGGDDADGAGGDRGRCE